MKSYSALSICLAAILLFLLSCSSDSTNSSQVEPRCEIAIPVTFPENGVTRVEMTEDGLGFSPRWSYPANEELHVLFLDRSGRCEEVPAYIDENSICNNYKTCIIRVSVPSDIQNAESFEYTLYGVVDRNVTVLDHSPLFDANLRRTVFTGRNIPVWFKSHVKYDPTVDPEPVYTTECHHLGAYEIVHFKNLSENDVHVKFLGFEVEDKWYHEFAGYRPAADEVLFNGASYADQNPDDAEAKLGHRRVKVFMTWYIPTGKRISNASMLAEIDGQLVKSSNTLSSNQDIQKGHAYHIYAVWDGKELLMGKDIFIEDFKIDTNELVLNHYESASVKILSGNGSYKITVDHNEVVTVKCYDNTLNIRGINPGEAEITIEDNVTRQLAYIKVVVNATNPYLAMVMKDMVRVDGGTFMMGKDSGDDDFDSYLSALPVHQVTLSDFYISKYEVTQGLWKAIMGDLPSGLRDWELGDNKPVGLVSRNNVESFFNELARLSGMHFRLPTEAEWEYAARGGVNASPYMYSGSDDLDEVCIYYNRNRGDVGSKKPNALGLYDMSGGVYEMCSDNPYEYTERSVTDPRHDLVQGYQYIMRWGCPVWYRDQYEGLSTYRSDIGFRIARSWDPYDY